MIVGHEVLEAWQIVDNWGKPLFSSSPFFPHSVQWLGWTVIEIFPCILITLLTSSVTFAFMSWLCALNVLLGYCPHSSSNVWPIILRNSTFVQILRVSHIFDFLSQLLPSEFSSIQFLLTSCTKSLIYSDRESKQILSFFNLSSSADAQYKLENFWVIHSGEYLQGDSTFAVLGWSIRLGMLQLIFVLRV